MKTMFIDDKTALTQTVHFGMIVKDAKRTTKIQIYIRRYKSNTMGWVKPFCTILQIIEFETLSPTLCTLAQISSKDVSSCRPFSCSHIRHSSRYWKDSKYSITHSQRSYPTNFGPAQLSSSGYLKDFPFSSFRKEHRFIVIRRPKSLEPEEVQRSLFTFKNYVYCRALVPNLGLTPEGVWRFYCNRGFQELLLRELKNSFFMAQIPTRSFWANAAYMEIILWAYDLVLAFQYLCLPEEVQHWNISTLRRELWWLPAEWVNHGSSNILWLPKQYPQQDLFFKIQRAISKVKPLI